VCARESVCACVCVMLMTAFSCDTVCNVLYVFVYVREKKTERESVCACHS